MTGPKHNIVVEAVSHFLPGESEPARDHYVFSYTITIRNAGEVPARLISRRWIITDANGEVRQVNGEGVVGQQPRLEPGEAFRYTSGTSLPTAVGVMEGSYQMVDDEGTPFDAVIAPFTLAIPRTLH